MSSTVSKSGRETRRTYSPLQLAGNARHQEANRKLLLRGLKWFASDHLRKAEKAQKFAAALEALDVETIAKNRGATRRLLCDILRLENVHLDFWVARLLGVARSAITDCLFATDEPASDDSPSESTKPPQVAETKAPELAASFSAEAALAEACRIVARATDEDLDEIDWTLEPRSDRERALRQAIIKRIEAEGRCSPCGTWNALTELLSDEEDRAGYAADDLSDALDRCEKRCDEYDAERKGKERHRLLDAADYVPARGV